LVKIELVVLESERFKCTSLYKPMQNEAPLVGPFFGGFYFDVQTLLTMSKGCYIWNSFTFGLLVHKKRDLNVFPYINICKMKCPLVGPFLGGIYFYAQLYKPCPKDAVSQISEYLECQFMRRWFYKIDQIWHLFAPYWATKFGWNWFSGFGEKVI